MPCWIRAWCSQSCRADIPVRVVCRGIMRGGAIHPARFFGTVRATFPEKFATVIFIEWWAIERLGLLLLVVATASLIVWSVRKERRFVRFPVQVILGLFLFALLCLVTLVSSLPGSAYSEPVYSPNRKMAASIVEYNASGLGGADDTVKLFRAHGFSSDVVFFGEFNSVKAQNIRWKSDSELEISYEGTPYRCTSTRHVRVLCLSVQKNVRQ